MSFALAARVQAVLEGVELPADKSRLLAYAHAQEPDGEVERALATIPDREYRSLDEVGEELAPVQPDRRSADAALPRAESGDPPGDDAYTDPKPDTGRMRPRTPQGPYDEGLSGKG